MNEMRPPRAKARKHDISAIASRYDRVALVLQGGGALGAYQNRRPSGARGSHRRHQFRDHCRQWAGKTAGAIMPSLEENDPSVPAVMAVLGLDPKIDPAIQTYIFRAWMPIS